MLTAAAGVWKQTLELLRECGRFERECVTYWTGPVHAPALLDGVIHPLHDASEFSYEVSNEWLNGLWMELARAERSIRVQVHTHAGRASHSLTDDKWPIVGTPGFVSLVVPRFARHPVDLDQLYVTVLGESGWRKSVLSCEVSGLR